MNPHADSVQQPSDDEERAAFEAWRRATTNVVTPDRAIARDGFGDDANYAHRATQSMWIGWKGRAIARFGTRPAAEPSQSGSAGEALLATAPKFEECETPEPSLSSLIYRYYRAHFEDRAQADGYASRYIAALSRQAPAAPTQALLGWTRYEKARKLNPAQWAELHQRNLRGENFDDMIDALPAATQPAQQDTRYGTEQYLRGFNDAKAQFATPPAEKQAAPSGEALLLMMRAQAERMPDMTQIEALRLIDMALQDAKGTKS
jgi:hypothetical protein